jgi:hypothetical protein
MTLLFYTKDQVAERKKEKIKRRVDQRAQLEFSSRLRQVKGNCGWAFLPYNEHYHYTPYIFWKLFVLLIIY